MPARKPEADDEDERITRAVEVLRAAYLPAATRGTLVQAISEALDAATITAKPPKLRQVD
jgi:hypothetical protein